MTPVKVTLHPSSFRSLLLNNRFNFLFTDTWIFAMQVLNYLNSESDRKIVTGEKSLNISDKIPFSRKVFQSVTSSPFVRLKDGFYTMKASIRNSSGFTKLEMYAASNGKFRQHRIVGEHITWDTITIPHIPVKGGKVEIGFLAEGIGGSFCQVDDISLVAE